MLKYTQSVDYERDMKVRERVATLLVKILLERRTPAAREVGRILRKVCVTYSNLCYHFAT